MIPDYVDFWPYYLSLRFLIPAGLVLVPFLFLLWSVAETWFAQAEKEQGEGEYL
ncbi:MAG: hypothetical protein KDE19_23020 [Caldilineaceae bacterium]|nr:hypothetical protein [Caldilineaceae bacterium]